MPVLSAPLLIVCQNWVHCCVLLRFLLCNASLLIRLLLLLLVAMDNAAAVMLCLGRDSAVYHQQSS
jgi:hypothetical protein